MPIDRLAAIERSWIAWPSGWTAKLSARISEAQRSRRERVHGDGDDPAERQAADVRAADAERVERGEDRARRNRRESRSGTKSLSP